MSLILLNFPASTCSQKVRLALWEKNLEFEDRGLMIDKGEHLTKEYLKLNPNGVVPTLLHNDEVIIDSSVIMEYLDEVFPENPLSPSDPVGRAHMRKWMRYFEEVSTPATRIPSFNKHIAAQFGNMPDEAYNQMADNHPMRKHFFQHLEKGVGFSERETEDAMDHLRQTLERMEMGLGHGKPWLLGDMLTNADYCVTPTIDRMNDIGLSNMWDDKPLVSAWFDRIQEREAFKKAFYTGTRLTDYSDGQAA